MLIGVDTACYSAYSTQGVSANPREWNFESLIIVIIFLTGNINPKMFQVNFITIYSF